MLDNNGMRGQLGAYSKENNEIYLNSELDSTPSLLKVVLTHELGHAILDKLVDNPTDSASTQATINRFVVDLIPEASDVFMVINKAMTEPKNTDSKIVLPNGETVKAEMFDTPLHIAAEKSTYYAMNSAALETLALAQNHVDDLDLLRNKQSLQFRSAAHFDNNDIEGGLTMVRNWYADGIKRFNDADISAASWSKSNDSDPNWASGLVNPAFPGANGGIDLLLYRFGQVLHALQDFYTHSNWLSLTGEVRGKPLPTDSILDNGLGLPTILHAGQAIPGTRAGMTTLIAGKGPDWGQLLKKTGDRRESWNLFGATESVYWKVNSDTQSKWDGTTKIFGLVDPILTATTLNGKEIYGLATGSTWGLVYKDENKSVPFRDPSKAGSVIAQEYFKGFNHGGIAGTGNAFVINPITGQGVDEYLGPLAKDAETSFSYDEAMRYANLQIKNEWDRLGHLIYNSYGVDGLQRFANYALWDQDRQQYIDTYSKPDGRWAWNNLPAFTTDLTSPHTLGSKFEGAQLRFINLVSNSIAKPGTQDLNIGIQFKLIDGDWTDSAYASLSALDRHGDLSDEMWTKILTPAGHNHTVNGARAYWIEPNNEGTFADGVTYVVEDANQSVAIDLTDFDTSRDKIMIIDSAGKSKVEFSGHWSKAEYLQNKSTLHDTYNINIHQAIHLRPDNHVWTIDAAKIVLANGSVEGLALAASDLFSEAYEEKSGVKNTLQFTSYDNTAPFLKLIDGHLVALANANEYSGKTYSVEVSVSDGVSGLLDQTIDIKVAPSLAAAGGNVLKSGQSLAIKFAEQAKQACSLLAGINTDSGSTAANRVITLASLTGSVNGNPKEWDPLSQTASLGSISDNGTLTFYTYDTNSNNLTELTLEKQENGAMNLLNNGKVFATITETSPASPKLFNVNTYPVAGAVDHAVGFTLPSDSKNFKIGYSIYSSAAFKSEFGLFMTDAQTGNIVDPITGHLYDNKPENLNAILATSSLFKSAVTHDRAITGYFDVKLDSAIPTSEIIFTPFIKTVQDGKTYVYSGDSKLNSDGIDHAVMLSANSFGFEDVYGGGDRDYNDVIFALNDVTVTPI